MSVAEAVATPPSPHAEAVTPAVPGNGDSGHDGDSARPIVLHAAGTTLKNIRAILLLGGTVRPTPLNTSIGRSVLDLPLDNEHNQSLGIERLTKGELAA